MWGTCALCSSLGILLLELIFGEYLKEYHTCMYESDSNISLKVLLIKNTVHFGMRCNNYFKPGEALVTRAYSEKGKKLTEFSTGVKPMTFQLLVQMLYHWATLHDCIGDSWELTWFMWQTFYILLGFECWCVVQCIIWGARCIELHTRNKLVALLCEISLSIVELCCCNRLVL